jgi:hypothetical protein
MKIKAQLSYSSENELEFNQLLYEKTRGSIWYNQSNFTAFEIDKILGEELFILPDTTKEVILNILDSSVAKLLQIGETVHWGVPYKVIGNIIVIEVIIPCKVDYFGTPPNSSV